MDTSVWIDFFGSSPGPAGRELRRMINDAEPFALSGVIIQEILQGLTRNIAQIGKYLSLWDTLEPTGLSTYCEAAAIFRLARGKGISVTTVDSLIAAIALENQTAVFTLDKDFSRVASITNLLLHTMP